jgi:hypothetical protein
LKLPHVTLTGLLLIGLAFVGLVSAAWGWLQWCRVESVVPAHTYRLQADRINEWTRFGGSSEITDGAVRSDSNERGAKLLAGSRHWSNYTVNTDIQFDGPAADMGVVIRTKESIHTTDTSLVFEVWTEPLSWVAQTMHGSKCFR